MLKLLKLWIYLLISTLMVLAVDSKQSSSGYEEQDLLDLVRNFTAEWKDYVRTWNEYHDTVPPEALGYKDFACDTTLGPSDHVPTNVHMLRPNDIGVIAALGDSLTAGNGAGGHKLMDVALEYRGVSFPIGGDGVLEDTLTLPNIIRKYNSGLYGASLQIGAVDNLPFSQLNVAIPGSRARDMPGQARELVSRLRSSPRFKDMWKMVTLFIGANDVCWYCNDDKDKADTKIVTKWLSDIETAIGILSQGLSKVLLNLVPAPPVGNLRAFDTHPMCKIMHQLECPCIGLASQNHSRSDEVNREYQERLYELVGQYERFDFAVVVQPFSRNISVPINPEKHEADLSYMAPDCFHFNRRSHSASAAALWNNMIQPVGAKDSSTNPSIVRLQCPDKDCPYIRTALNSVNCSNTFLSQFTSKRPRTNMASITNFATNETESANRTGPGPAIWIFVGLLVTLIGGMIIMYCTYKDKLVERRTEKKIREIDEHTPLIMRSMENLMS